MTHTISDERCRHAAAAEAAVESRGESLTANALRSRVTGLADEFRALAPACVALYADNGCDWIVADLACLEAHVRIVPIPLFFSREQIDHALATSGADLLLSDRSVPGIGREAQRLRMPAAGRLQACSLPATASVRLPAGTQKITYTSGSTGMPKGVCLSDRHPVSVAESLVTAIDIPAPRHLCILPLATLLENVAGVYAPLLAGGTVIAPPLADVGLSGSSSLDIHRLLECLSAVRPDTLILVPEILRALCAAAERGWRPPSSLRFAAVGGAKVAPRLVERARGAGIPVFEGYGLSECASVVALNTPAEDRVGSVGRPLPHVGMRIEDGEIVVSGSRFLGYVDQPETWAEDEVKTGDIGRLDDAGFVHIDGRAKHLLITGFGRNVSPEWVESELLAGPILHQAVVVGDARPWCSALLVPRDPAATDEEIDAWVLRTNQRLPDYARIVDWRRLSAPLTAGNGLLTGNGRPRRKRIEQVFRTTIDHLYAIQAEASNQ